MLGFWLAMQELPVPVRQQVPAAQYEAWLAGVARGDPASFEALYRATDHTLYAFALSLARNRDDAQDIMMETYLKIRAGAGSYLPQGKPLAWMFTIARNVWRSDRRKAARETPMDELPPCENTDADEPLRALVLREALRVLDEQEREIVLLHAVSGMKHRELAAALGLPLATVLSKYARALRKLKRELEGEGDAR